MIYDLIDVEVFYDGNYIWKSCYMKLEVLRNDDCVDWFVNYELLDIF